MIGAAEVLTCDVAGCTSQLVVRGQHARKVGDGLGWTEQLLSVPVVVEGGFHRYSLDRCPVHPAPPVLVEVPPR